MPKEKLIKDRFLEKLDSDDSIDWERKTLTTSSLIMDILYLLGVSIDSKKYGYHSGFEKFLSENGVSLSLKKTEINPVVDDEISRR